MKFKVTAQVEGEDKVRQKFAPDRGTAGRIVTQMLGDPTVPAGTEVRVVEEREVVVAAYVKKAVTTSQGS